MIKKFSIYDDEGGTTVSDSTVVTTGTTTIDTVMKYILTTISALFLSLFASAQMDMMLGVPATSSSYSYLIDDFGGAWYGFAMNKISSGAANCVTIKRSSDGDTLVIGFSGNDWDSASALSFVGGGTGWVKTWWDQSGNNRHAIQTDSLKMPRLIISGVVNTENGIAAIRFDGTNDYLANTTQIIGGSVSQPYSKIVLGTWKSTPSGYLSDGGLLSSYRNAIGVAPGQFWRIFSGSVSDYASTAATNTQYLLYTIFNGASSQLYVNSSGLGVKNVGTNVMEGVTIGCGQNLTSAFANSNIQLLVAWPSDQSTNRTGIESNINSYYSIY